MRTLIAALFAVVAWSGIHAPREHVQEPASEVETISVCALHVDRAAYDHKLIDVRGTVSHGFEDFMLSDAGCGESLDIWLEYGGTVSSNTIYGGGGMPGAPRGEVVMVEGIRIPLVKDALFRRFDQRIQGRRETRFRARMVGRFFSGVKQQYGDNEVWVGYGHFGFHSLLMIQQVLALDADVDKGE